MTSISLVLPNDIDDPRLPSGGNSYDRQISRGLAASGWSVQEHAVHGAWPRPGRAELADLARVLAELPDGALVLLDGLVASAAPDVLQPVAGRLRLVVLVHLPLGEDTPGARAQEERALSAASAVVTTSDWTRRRLLELYPLPAHRVHVAPPGVDPAPRVPGSAEGSQLLCVAAVTPHKGHDVLLAALASIPDRPWACVCVGSLDRDPGFVQRLRRQAVANGIADRVDFVGPKTGAGLEARYAAADLLVLASHGETYGMVVTEALAHAIPVLATSARGLPDALGLAPDGSRPGLLVPPDDPAAVAGALRRWLDEPELRQRLRTSAEGRRDTLTGWAVTADLVAAALSGATFVGTAR
jgi:glycosyltransferase involved in cell wall biosynthesis